MSEQIKISAEIDGTTENLQKELDDARKQSDSLEKSISSLQKQLGETTDPAMVSSIMEQLEATNKEFDETLDKIDALEVKINSANVDRPVSVPVEMEAEDNAVEKNPDPIKIEINDQDIERLVKDIRFATDEMNNLENKFYRLQFVGGSLVGAFDSMRAAAKITDDEIDSLINEIINGMQNSEDGVGVLHSAFERLSEIISEVKSKQAGTSVAPKHQANASEIEEVADAEKAVADAVSGVAKAEEEATSAENSFRNANANSAKLSSEQAEKYIEVIGKLNDATEEYSVSQTKVGKCATALQEAVFELNKTGSTADVNDYLSRVYACLLDGSLWNSAEKAHIAIKKLVDAGYSIPTNEPIKTDVDYDNVIESAEEASRGADNIADGFDGVAGSAEQAGATVEKEMNRIVQEEEYAGDGADEFGGRLGNAIANAGSKIASGLLTKIREMRIAVANCAREIGSNFVAPITGAVRGFHNLAKSIDPLRSVSGVFRTIGDNLAQLGTRVGTAINPISRLNSVVNAAFHPINTFKKGLLGLSKAISGLKRIAGSVVGTIRKLGSVIGSLKKSSGKASGAMDGLNKGFKKGFKNILRYAFGIRSVFVLIRKLRSAIKEGFSNLFTFDTELAQKVNDCKLALTNLKNAFATAFAPIVSIVVPVITKVINYLTLFFNKVAQIVAALTGAKTYTKALTGTASAMSDNADSAKDASDATKDYLSGLDEINKLEDESSSGSGSGGSTDDIGSGFETAEIESGLSDIAEKLKEMWENADFTELGEKITKTIADALDQIDWATVQSFANRLAKSVATLINGIFGNPEDWYRIGNAIGNAVNTITGALKTFFDNIKLDQIGASLAAGINGLVNAIDFAVLGEVIARLLTWKLQLVAAIADNIDWTALGLKISEGVNSFVATITDVFANINFGGIATKMFTGLNAMIANIKWYDIGKMFATMFNGALDFIYNAVSTFNWSGAGTALGSAIQGFISNVKWGELGGSISTAVKGILDFFISAVVAIDWTGVGENILTMLQAIDWAGIVSRIFELAGDLAGALAALAKGLFSDAIATLSEWWNGAAFDENGNFTWDGLLNGLVDALSDIGQWLYDNVWVPFKTGFCEAFGIASPSTKMYELGGYIIEGLLNGITDVWNTITEFFSGCWDAVSSTVSDAWGTVKETVTTKAGEVWDKVSGTWSDIKDSTSEKWDTVKSSVSDTWSNLKTNASTAVNNIKSNVSSGWNTLKTNTSTKWNELKNNTTKTFDSLKSGLTTKVSSLSSTMSSKWESMKSTAGTKFESLKSTVSGKISSLSTTLSTKWETIKTNATTKWEGIKSSIQGIDWGSVGTHIKNGIFEKMSDFGDKVSTFASGLLGSVKSALGINSPSTLFRDEVGTYLSAGISEGMGNADMTSTVQKMGSMMVAQMQSAYAKAIAVWQQLPTALSAVSSSVLSVVSDMCSSVANVISNGLFQNINIVPKVNEIVTSVKTVFTQGGLEAGNAFVTSLITGISLSDASSVVSGITSLMNKIVSVCSNGGRDSASNFITKFTSGITFKSIESKVKSLCSSITSQFKDAGKNSGNTFSTGIANAISFTKVLSTIKSASSKIVSLFKDCATSSVKQWSNVSSSFSNICSSIVKAFNSMPRNIQTLFKNAYQYATNAWSSAKSNFSSIATSIVSSFNPVSSSIPNYFRNGYSSAYSSWSGSRNAFYNYANGVINSFSNVPGSIYNYFRSAMSNASSAWNGSYWTFRDYANDVINAFSDIRSRMYNIFSYALSSIYYLDWYNTGYYVVQGVISGMYDNYSSISRWASNFLWRVQQALDINSPSKLFRDEVGKYLGAGIGEGLEGSERGLLSTIRDIGNTLVDAFNDITDDLSIDVPLTGNIDVASYRPTISTGSVLPTMLSAIQSNQSANDMLETLTTLVNALAGNVSQANAQNNANTYNVSVNVDGRNLFNFIIDEATIKQRQSGQNPLLLGG